MEVVAELAELTSGDVNEIMMSITLKNEWFNRIMNNYNHYCPDKIQDM